jgi:dihydrolipoamide dehydrogenase
MYDLAIMGAGPGGYVAAIRGAQHGLKVLLIEKDALGGACLNRGCIPTKCFINDTKLLKAAKDSPVLKGMDHLSIDLPRMVSRKRHVVKTLVGGIEVLMKSNHIDVIKGRGEILSPGRVNVHPVSGRPQEYEARQMLIATGSRPAIPPFLQIDGHLVQTTDEALESADLPNKLLIIGGGVIGVEMATIYRTLGSEVTLLELLPDIIMTEDAEIRRAMRMLMEQGGIKIHLKCKVKEVTSREGKAVVLYEEESGKIRRLVSDRVLACTGRAPVLDGIDIQKLGIQMEGPFLKVNPRFETNLPGIYAIGDVIGGMMLAHKASAEAEAVVSNIDGKNKKVKSEWIPRCIWGLTEIGSVGLTEEEAKVKGIPFKVGRFSYLNSAAAQAGQGVNGVVKIVGESESGRILGVHIMGAHATDLIGEAVMAMTMEAAVEDLAEVIKPHPTLSENIMEAAMDWSGFAIHKTGKN